MGQALLYELTWRDIIHVLGQMLTPDSKTQVLKKPLLLEMNGLNARKGERGNMK